MRVQIVIALVLSLNICFITCDATKAKIDLFVMSKCPDVKNFYDNIFGNIYKQLNSIIDLNINFIAKVDPTQKYGFNSLHGVTEVEGDLLEICAQNLYVKENEFFKLHLCLNPSMAYIPRNVQECTSKVSFDYNKIQACAFGSTGKGLLTKSIGVTDVRGISWSPTMWLNDKPFCEYGGGACQASSYADFVRDICNATTITPKPVVCNE